MTAATLAPSGLASGKGHKDENFPVASRLVAARHRAPIMAFYAFARGADDVADHPSAGAPEKLARLEAMRRTLLGAGDADPAALRLRATMAAHGLDRIHALDLLEAFTRDVTVDRYQSWDALIDYCRYSAMPVGRYVLDVHGEDRALWPASDALCAALQVINHLQDIGKDLRDLGRIYLPEDILARHGASADDLRVCLETRGSARFEAAPARSPTRPTNQDTLWEVGWGSGPVPQTRHRRVSKRTLSAARAAPGLRAAIAEAAERTQDLLARSAGFAGAIRDTRLGCEVAVIQRLAVSLAARLRARDPLAERVHHGKAEMLTLAAGAVFRRMLVR